MAKDEPTQDVVDELEPTAAELDEDAIVEEAPEAELDHSAAAGGGTSPEELAQGFIGDKVDELDNEAYSLESGPDAPVLNAATDAHAPAEAEDATDDEALEA